MAESTPAAPGDESSPQPIASVLQEELDSEENGLEFQIALNSLAAGNSEPLKNYLARIQGLDPQQYSIRSKPFNVAEESRPDSKLSYVGEMDDIGGEVAPALAVSSHKPPSVLLTVPTQMYTYRPLLSDLKQIRLLRCWTGDEQATPDALKLQTFELSSAPRFYALSYVWGQPDKIMPLPCKDGKIMITQNLFRALETSLS